MNLRRLFAVALIGSGLAAAAAAQTWTFDVSPGELLEVDLEPGGDVEIRGVPGNQVKIVADVGGRNAADLRISAEKSARGVRVRADMATGRRTYSIDAGLMITVPERFDLDLSSSGGGFTVVGVEGTIDGETQGGEVELERVRGTVSIETMGGAITAKQVDASGKVETMGGSIRFVDVRGGLEGSTMGGTVTLEGGGFTRLSTMGGAVRVKSAPEGAKVSTMGGQVDVESAHAPFEASTMGGDLDVRIDGGAGDVELSSMGGDLLVVLPPGFAGEIDAEIVQTRGRDGAYVIDSEFELEKGRGDRSSRERRGRSWGDGDREVVWYGRSAQKGGDRVVLSTVNGDIRIRRG